MSFLKFFLLISIISLSLQAVVDTNKDKKEVNETKNNMTETISDYFSNISLVKKWNYFTNMLYNLFHIKPTQTESSKDIKQQVSEYNKKIADYFKKNMPKENYTEMLTNFSDKMSGYISSAGAANNKTLDLFYDKLHDFSSNFTDFFNQYNLTDKKSNLKENFTTFLDKVEEYFKSNYTSFNEYMADTKTGKHLPNRTFPGDIFTYVLHYHEHFFYPADYLKGATCNAEQIDRCNHLCREDKKVLCGCYIHKGGKNEEQKEKKVDCVCSENEMTCNFKHVHKDISKEPKKDIL